MKVPHATKDPEDSDDTHVEHEIDEDGRQEGAEHPAHQQRMPAIGDALTPCF